MAVTRRRTLTGFAAATTAAVFGAIHRATPQTRRPRIAVVAKVADSPWFDAMETGMKEAAQEQLSFAKELLETRVLERTAELARANSEGELLQEALRESDRRKYQFTATTKGR